MKKIRQMSTVAFIVLIPYALYYPYEAISWQLDMAFLTPERWFRGSWAHPEAQVHWMTRMVYFSVWFSAVICGIVALAFAFRTVLLFRAGVVFDEKVATSIFRLGVWLSLSNAVHIAAACVSPMIVSWHNPDGPLPLRFWYSSTHLALILCGLAFLLMGAVMREAIRLARENEEFV